MLLYDMPPTLARGEPATPEAAFWPKYRVPSIVEQYHRDREAADTGEDKRRVWRTYARAVIEETASRPLGGHLPWRRAAGDDDLPVRYPPYWASIPRHDLEDLWLALERARHRASDE